MVEVHQALEEEHARFLDGFDHGVAIGNGGCEGFLAENGFSCLGCFDGCVGVEVGWEADVYHVYFGVLEQGIDVGVLACD